MQMLAYSTRTPPRHMPGLKMPYVRLCKDNWDDYGYKTRFIADLVLSETEVVELGAVRIAHDGKGFRPGTLPRVINELPAGAGSLGESIVYYRRIGTKLSKKVMEDYLATIKDVVSGPERGVALQTQGVWDSSFLRQSSAKHALARGGIYIGAPCQETEPPKFGFEMTVPGAARPHTIGLDFSERKGLPHRKMLFVGRNGTGKTKALASLATALMPEAAFSAESIANVVKSKIKDGPAISRVIAISYNAFDEFPLPAETGGKVATGVEYRSKLSYKYCGLRTSSGNVNINEVALMLEAALEPVVESEREEVAERVLRILLGADLAASLCGSADERKKAVESLSAGQRLVAAIFCNIVGFIEEGSLLLIDEPETHLHPGLLSSVAVALDDVLKEFDSFAVVATHSPILLQQVPSNYVRVFRRTNDVAEVAPLQFESFGEDLGELTRKVLGLAEPERDYTHVLNRLYSDQGSVEGVEELFMHPLGLPAKAHLFSLADGSVEPEPEEAA